MSAIGSQGKTSAAASFEIASEFAAVRVSLDTSGRGPRLLVEDLESGDNALIDALELASFCRATQEQRRDWLRTGPYQVENPGEAQIDAE